MLRKIVLVASSVVLAQAAEENAAVQQKEVEVTVNGSLRGMQEDDEEKEDDRGKQICYRWDAPPPDTSYEASDVGSEQEKECMGNPNCYCKYGHEEMRGTQCTDAEIADTTYFYECACVSEDHALTKQTQDRDVVVAGGSFLVVAGLMCIGFIMLLKTQAKKADRPPPMLIVRVVGFGFGFFGVVVGAAILIAGLTADTSTYYVGCGRDGSYDDGSFGPYVQPPEVPIGHGKENR